MPNLFSKEEDQFLFQLIYEGGHKVSEINKLAYEKFNEKRNINSYSIRIENLIYFFTEGDYRYMSIGIYHEGEKIKKLPLRQKKELDKFLEKRSKEIFIYNLESFGYSK